MYAENKFTSPIESLLQMNLIPQWEVLQTSLQLHNDVCCKQVYSSNRKFGANEFKTSMGSIANKFTAPIDSCCKQVYSSNIFLYYSTYSSNPFK